MSGPVCFVDCETTGLDPDRHEIWEVALITPVVGMTAAEDTWNEQVWQLPVDLSQADPMALHIGRFHDRRPGQTLVDLDVFAEEFVHASRGLHLVGACVSFDADRLWRLLRRSGECPMWHYHLVDVEALAAGWLAGRARGVQLAAPPEGPECAWTMSNTEDGPEARCKVHSSTHAPITTPALAQPPWDSTSLSRAVGIEPSQFDRHTALGDARWAKAIYEAVMG